MVWEGYWSRLCKCKDFNVYGLFGRDNLLCSPLIFKNFDICPHCRAKGFRARCGGLSLEIHCVTSPPGPHFIFVFFFGADTFLPPREGVYACNSAVSFDLSMLGSRCDAFPSSS